MIPVYVDGSVEYLKAEVTSDSVELDDQPVSFHLAGVEHPGTWMGTDPALVRTARTTSVIDFTTVDPGVHEVLVEVHDSPEVPVISAGYISVQTQSE